MEARGPRERERRKGGKSGGQRGSEEVKNASAAGGRGNGEAAAEKKRGRVLSTFMSAIHHA